MKIKPYKTRCLLSLLTIFLISVFCTSISAYASTDDNPLQVTDEVWKLEIYLGEEWAGAKFELQTQAGTFPVPVVVSEDGLLRMELGGPDTYSLRLLESENVSSETEDTSSNPVTSQETDSGRQNSAETFESSMSAADSEDPEKNESSVLMSSDIEDGESDAANAPPQNPNTIPTLHIIFFVGGLIICIATLVTMSLLKRRRQALEDDDDF
jgi:hypothetical protein